MMKNATQAKKAVEVGYWQLFRYNPALVGTGKNPFTLDSKEPKPEGFKDFLMSERRYAKLARQYPDVADELFEKNKKDALARYAGYKKLAEE